MSPLRPFLTPVASMQKIILLMIVCLLYYPLAEAKNFKFDVGLGYRQDRLEWELAGANDHPPVISRLTWKDLDIIEMTAQLRKITCNNIYFRGYGNYGWIYHGKVRDSDFRLNGSDDIVEYSIADCKGNHGRVWDGSVGVGYFYRFECWSQLRLAPLIGYSLHEQRLHMYDGVQVRDLDRPEFEGHHILRLHNTYDARWMGPWLGTDIYFNCNDQLTLNSSLEYHWMIYRAKGHWNLRDDFDGPFKHTGHAHGFRGSLGMDYLFCDRWYVGGELNFSYAKLKNGRDRTPLKTTIQTGVVDNRCRKSADGALEDAVVKGEDEIVFNVDGKLRSVTWCSVSCILTVGYNF